MSYYCKEKSYLRKLTKINEYPYLNERFVALKSNKHNVIEVGFWISDILNYEGKPLRFENT
ncbi:MAG: hypothetical protein JSV49_08505 [Thermoplasmata archaeon]|nr:MAG: hypothetical protein JSV49_08505 [Thermoplasmata archaeon]